MKRILCPKCGKFALVFEEASLGHEARYVCPSCGAILHEDEVAPILNEDAVQRFPGPKDNVPTSPMEEFLRRKKQ